MNLSDNYIIKSILKGNKEGYEILFKRYSNKIFYLAMKYTKNVDDSNDCVQEVFIRVIEHIQDFNCTKSKFSTWLYTITINYLKDKIKSDCRWRKIVCVDEESVYNYSSYNLNGYNIVLLSEIENLIGIIPYHIIFLRKGMGLSFNEIAKSLGMTTSKVKHIFYNSYEVACNYLKRGGVNYEQESR